MNRRHLLALGGGIPAFAWTGCSRRRSRSGTTLRVGLSPYLSMSPFYLAQELGYFSAAGFSLEMERPSGSAHAIPLLAAGKLDVAFPSVSPSFLSAVAGGAALKIVAGRSRAAPGCSDTGALFANRRSFPKGLKDLRELKGKRVAYFSKANLGEFFMDTLLGTAGMDSRDVVLVALQPAEASAALVGGNIDAMISSSVFGRELDDVSSSVIRGIGVADVLPNFQYSHVVFGRTLLDSDPKIGARFLSALLKGTRDFVAGKTPRFMDDYARSNHMDPESVRKVCRANVSADGQIDLRSLQQFVDWSSRKGYSPGSRRASELVDMRFLEELHRQQTVGRSWKSTRGETV